MPHSSHTHHAPCDFAARLEVGDYLGLPDGALEALPQAGAGVKVHSRLQRWATVASGKHLIDAVVHLPQEMYGHSVALSPLESRFSSVFHFSMQ